MSTAEALPGCHLALCRARGGAEISPADEGCAENCPRRLRAEVGKLEAEVKRLHDGVYEHAAWGAKALPVGANPAPHDYRLWQLLDGDR